jgi:Lysophospholipase
MHINRPALIDDFAFSAAMTVASRTLFLRDRLFRRVSRNRSETATLLKHSRHTIASGDEVLDAVFMTPGEEPARAAVLLCHGIGETVDYWLGVQSLLAAYGIASLVFDYAGYGQSTGRIRWKQCENDAIQAFAALQLLAPDTPASILGFSLGSGVAAAVLESTSPEKLILCSSFSSFRAAACCVGLPRPLSFLAPPIWNTEQAIRRCSLPVLVLHCKNDRLFPTQMASSLASGCGERTRLVIVPDHRHNDPYYRPQRQFWEHVVSHLASDHRTPVSAALVSEETH